jgi:hypothetical protein
MTIDQTMIRARAGNPGFPEYLTLIDPAQTCLQAINTTEPQGGQMPITLDHMKTGRDHCSLSRNSIDEDKTETVHRDLPLGMTLNSLVQIPTFDFIPNECELKIKQPTTLMPVSAYGVIFLEKTFLHRFYLEAKNGTYMIETLTDKDMTIKECKLFMLYDEMYPGDWDFWLSDLEGSIGLGIFMTRDETLYFRVWDNEDEKKVVEEDEDGHQLTWIPPVQFEEIVCFASHDREPETVYYYSMLYGREVTEYVDEFLLLSAADEHKGASVKIMVGIELDPGSIKVSQPLN